MNIYESITKIMEEVPSIGKNQRNKTQGFMYRGIDDVMNALQPLLAKNKVFIVPEILEQTREERISSKGGNLIYSICKIKYKFYAEDGSSVEAITIGEGMDSGDKATNKAMAIAMKYALFQVFCIPTDEMKDPDSETPEQSTKKNNAKTVLKLNNEDGEKPISETYIKAFTMWLKNHNISDDTLLEILSKYQYTKIEEIKVKDYKTIVNILNSTLKEDSSNE
nr:MAG TPA: ERF superfamily protein [Caudoviricetes sp.]